MKALVVMFDSLNRHFLPPYGNTEVHAPNFERLAERTATFDKSYICSMPCMPTRRDFHTGRPNFLHRGWGPLEPFDDSLPQLLRDAGVSSHMVTDHYHYFEDGGATYHNRYDTWHFIRGQEGDPWMGQVEGVNPAPGAKRQNACTDWNRANQDRINRQFIREEGDWPIVKTFDAGLDFLERNQASDNWFLQIETFDPHEPFFAHQRYRDLYGQAKASEDSLLYDWPAYDYATESEEEIDHVRKEYAAAVSMCDDQLGRVLDLMDAKDLWQDTMLIVWTDHGFMLGEHNAFGKCWLPFYEQISHTPLFIWDPRNPSPGERRDALVQPAIDLAPTLLEYFKQPVPSDMTGRSLEPAVKDDSPIKDSAVFGVAGGQCNITDGRYVYMRTPDYTVPRHDYTLMPTDMHDFFNKDNLRKSELAEPMGFTKDCPTLKVPRPDRPGSQPHPDVDRSLLFDLQSDPEQATPIKDSSVEARMEAELSKHFARLDVPDEVYQRFSIHRT